MTSAVGVTSVPGKSWAETEKLRLKAKSSKEERKKKGAGVDSKFDVAQFGSLEAFSRIQSFQDLVRGKEDDPLKSIDDKMTKLVENTEPLKDFEPVEIGGGDF